MPLRNVLIVEDDPVFAAMTRDALEGPGYNVEAVAATTAEALRAARQTPPDLALVDIMLPDERDGVESVKELRRLNDLAVIFLTASRDPEVIARAKALLPEAILTKPCDEGTLLLSVEAALARHKVYLEKRRSRPSSTRSCAASTTESSPPTPRGASRS